jgi:hypothetical protein
MMSRAARPVPRRWGRAVTVLAATAALSLVAAGCSAGQRPAAPAPQPAPRASGGLARPLPSGSTPAPARSPGSVPAKTVPSASAAVPPGPMFRAGTSALTAAMRARMTGVSWHPGCPVSLGQLRLLRLSYWGFDHAVHQGELVVNASATAGLARVFRLLFAARFPIRQMRIVDDFGGDDEASMLADNTSAFNCRLVPGTGIWSQHAYGLAVDANPLENPEVQNGMVDPPAAAKWADRSRSSPAMIKDGDAAWRAFRAIGWTWGGDWRSPKDYMHFSANGL